MAFSFRPLTRADLPHLHRWFSAPHASPWFHKRGGADAIDLEYGRFVDGSAPSHAFIALHEGRVVGMLQWERFGDHPWMQEAYGVEDPDAANCDVLIGEPDAARRGLGPLLLRAFLSDVVFRDPTITSCVIDPETDNAIAIRAYEKAGFRFLRAVAEDGEGGSVYLMQIDRDLPPPAPAPFFVRPAKEEELDVAGDIDDDACGAYVDAGLDVLLGDEHPFVLSEVARWRAASREGHMLFACAPDGAPVGFMVLGHADGKPFLQQVSVRRAWMGRGIGTALVTRAVHWSVRAGELWLTTYAGVPWNLPWYERLGFAVAAEAERGPELGAILDQERAALPAPERRVVMVYRHPRGATCA